MARTALATFVGVYLDEDLFEAYSNEFAAVDAFLVEQPRLASGLTREVDQLLASGRSEGELATAMAELGMGIDTNDLTYRAWLTQIADRVRATTGQR